MSDYMDRLIADGALREEMGHRAREWVCEAFDDRKQTRKLEEFYSSLIETYRTS